jgi:hypothetical protein
MDAQREPEHTDERGEFRNLLLRVALASGIGGWVLGAVSVGAVSFMILRDAPPPPPPPACHAPPSVVRTPPPHPPVCVDPDRDTGRLRPMYYDSDDFFPEDVTRIDFETAPDGRPLHPGDSVEQLFASRGVSLSTSIKTSYVGANSYVVDGRSGHNSAATVRPVWEGDMTLRFHRPGLPHEPATVHSFGVWIAYVVPHGTTLEALDRHGDPIGHVSTRCTGSDFLGFHSDEPIAAVRVVPNRAIDPNYTIDDIEFDPPR